MKAAAYVPEKGAFDARTSDNSEGSCAERDEDNAPVSASTPPPAPEPAVSLDPDAALRAAIAAAVVAGDDKRAAKLLAILNGEPEPAEERERYARVEGERAADEERHAEAIASVRARAEKAEAELAARPKLRAIPGGSRRS